MDAGNNVIPIIEDDMGEGFKDEVPPEINEKLIEAEKKLRKALRGTGFNHNK